MIYPDLEVQIPEELGRVHFVGIGGSGMSGIARMMHDLKLPVSGSDRSRNYNTDALQELGIKIFIGHSADNLGDVDTLVITGALWPENPEYQEALKRGLTVLHRSQALAWLTRKNRVVAVAGAHGKTTSTGMLVTGLLNLGVDASFVNGGIIEGIGLSSKKGSDDVFVIEADESDRSFLLYSTAIALITNVDPEHLDFYGSEEAFLQAFVEFVVNTKDKVVLAADDKGVQDVVARLPKEVLAKLFYFGMGADADLRILEIEATQVTRVTLEYRGEISSARLKIHGRHNAINVAGAVATLVNLGFGLKDSLAAVASFEGTKRRFEFHGDIAGVRLFDDYAHHPTEVQAMLQSARPVAGAGRIIAVHQPHLFSRTMIFAKEFAEVLETEADYTIVLPIDPAREDPVPGVTGEIVSNEFKDKTIVRYAADWDLAAKYLADIAKPEDIVITMSCGTVYQIIPKLKASLTERFLEGE